MKPNGALQTIFAFFLGLLILAFVAVAVSTFLPEPRWTAGDDGTYSTTYDSYRLTVGIVLLVCATALLVISLFLPEVQVVLSNGILLGGVFTMVYAVISTFVSGEVATFPTYVYTAYLRGIPAEANVIGFSMFVIAVLLVIGAQGISSWRKSKNPA